MAGIFRRDQQEIQIYHSGHQTTSWITSPIRAGRAATHQMPGQLPAYLTGLQQRRVFTADYPQFSPSSAADQWRVQELMRTNNHDILLLTLKEAFEILADRDLYKKGWSRITESAAGKIIINYGTNIKDVITTASLVIALGGFGVTATAFINHKGTELIKISGYPGVRKVLNAPVFSAKNPKVVDLGIGKYGLKNFIAQGARVTFYYAAAWRTIDYILTDYQTLSEYIGSLATDVIKIGITTVGSSMLAKAAFALPYATAPIVVFVAAGITITFALSYLENKFNLSDTLLNAIKSGIKND